MPASGLDTQRPPWGRLEATFAAPGPRTGQCEVAAGQDALWRGHPSMIQRINTSPIKGYTPASTAMNSETAHMLFQLLYMCVLDLDLVRTTEGHSSQNHGCTLRRHSAADSLFIDDRFS